MDSRAWLAHLEQFGIKLGLDTTWAIVAALGHPERSFGVIHVAGTNGKGSVSAMVSHALTAAGIRTGRYTSPHLVRLEERFAIDGHSATPAALDAALDRVRTIVSRLQSDGTLRAEPTYFEATTAAAFELFREAGVTLAVIEVGLGGRFDATNVVLPTAVAITSVDYDHQAQLGTSLAAIAAEKAGTIKPAVPVVIGRLAEEARSQVVSAAARQGAQVIEAHADTRVDARSDRGCYDVTLETPNARYGPLRLALAGRHQVDNAVVAVRLLETAAARGVRVGSAAIARGLTETRWPARLETITTPRGSVLVDGAHNPAGARALTSYLNEAHPNGLPLVVGMMRDKDHREILDVLAPWARPLVLTRALGPRAADPNDLASAVGASRPGTDLIVEPDPAAALERAWSYAPSIAVAGSLYLAGEVLVVLGRPID